MLTLDDVSGGRFLCGLGTRATSTRASSARSARSSSGSTGSTSSCRCSTGCCARIASTTRGPWYSARGARTLPGPVRHRVPLLVAANGPRSIRLAATLGDGWITYGGRGDTLDEWFAHVGELVRRFDDAVDAVGRGPLDRLLSLDSSPRFSLESVELYAEMAGRARELGFTDVVTHWPRPDGPYAGDLAGARGCRLVGRGSGPGLTGRCVCSVPLTLGPVEGLRALG